MEHCVKIVLHLGRVFFLFFFYHLNNYLYFYALFPH